MPQEPLMLMVSFDPSDPHVYRNLHTCLRQLTQKPDSMLDTLMANGRLIVKRRAHPHKDQKLVERLRATGAKCRFVASTTNCDPQAQTGAKTEQQPTELICPLCSHRQPPAMECRRCGVIIAKAKPRQDGLRTQIAAMEQTKADFPATQPASAWIKQARNHIRNLLQWFEGDTKKHNYQLSWSRKFSDALVRCAVVFGTTLILEIGLLLLANYLWFIYCWAPIGEHFNQIYSTQASILHYVFQTNPLIQSAQATLMSAAAAISFGILGRLLQINRFIFEPFGFLGRAIFWVLPVTVLTAWAALRQGVWDYYAVCFGLLLVPMLCLSGCCVALVKLIVPELSRISDTMVNLTREQQRLFAKIKSTLLGWLNL